MLGKRSVKLAAAVVCAAITGAGATYMSDSLSDRLFSASSGEASASAAAPGLAIFHPDQDDCLPVDGIEYLLLDAAPFVIRFPDHSEGDFVTRRRAMFALRSTTGVNDGIRAELMVDGMPAQVDIPRSKLWAARFCSGFCFSGEPLTEYKYSIRENVAPCAWQERKDNARLIFGAAFESMRDGDAAASRVLFDYGLRLDPTSSLGWFYYAEAYGEGFEKEWYRRALEIGLPAELELVAMERIREEQ